MDMERLAALSLGADHFVGGFQLGAVAANVGNVELWNPALSGKRLIVSRVVGQTGGAAFVLINRHGAALTTLRANLGNRVLGGAAPSAQIYADPSASTTGTTLTGVTIGANAPFDFIKPGEPPLIVAPGIGLIVSSTTVNLALGGIFSWREVAV